MSIKSKAVKSKVNAQGRHQFAALPYRFREGSVEVLVVTSRGTRQWVFPKGKPEKKMAPHRVAALEAEEEAGVKGKISRSPVGDFLYHKYVTPDKYLLCRMEVYLLKVQQELTEWKERGQRDQEWVPIDAVVARLTRNTNIPKAKKVAALMKAAKSIILSREKPKRKTPRKAKAENSGVKISSC